ncbi:hypothetical protein GGI59_006518 [Rhizobium lentis]|uniref:Uncharacterized protein n=1 Tax=Rhizobium lentis TaxID=1138194 RepID=A0A7W9CYN0_9HYPH|nr:hypothetical protein [Rhizobium lentis]MBB5554200.1 hypothetical protein [Rhizobium lentis]MBB5564807.1 hypothetical protein [Rhizobium lentis]MBB5571295.1 hypothetical protein [Rhizobium lentis]
MRLSDLVIGKEEGRIVVCRISSGLVCRPQFSQWRSITSAIDSALPQFGQPV